MASLERLSQIRDLVNQWEQIAGYQVSIPDFMVLNMADDPKAISTLYDLGQYLAGQVIAGNLGPPFGGNAPWVWYGMTATEWGQKMEQFDTAFRGLTGQQEVPTDLVTRALQQHQGRMTEAQFSQWLMTQDSIKNTYGWLKYGLDFQGFQQRKLEMRSVFGRELDDTQAVALLQYHHAAQGRDLTAVARPQSQQQQRGTAAVSGSVVR